LVGKNLNFFGRVFFFVGGALKKKGVGGFSPGGGGVKAACA